MNIPPSIKYLIFLYFFIFCTNFRNTLPVENNLQFFQHTQQLTPPSSTPSTKKSNNSIKPHHRRTTLKLIPQSSQQSSQFPRLFAIISNSISPARNQLHVHDANSKARNFFNRRRKHQVIPTWHSLNANQTSSNYS